MKKIFKLRAHHGMCLPFFIGEGYSSTFVENMTKQKQYLEENNPIIEIIASTDDICKKCPNNKCNICISYFKVKHYDNEVLNKCNLKIKDQMHYLDFISLVNKNIIQNNTRESICFNCKWNTICKNIEMNNR